MYNFAISLYLLFYYSVISLSMSHKETEKNGILHYAFIVIKYYLAPKLRTVLTILYFMFFSYFVIFYTSDVFLAFRFIWQTAFSSTLALSPDYMIWGSIFIVCLTIPFLASITALILPYEMRRLSWPRTTRVILVGIISITLIYFILFIDSAISYVAKETPIKAFIESKNIVLPG